MKRHKLVFGVLAILIFPIISQASEKGNGRAGISCYYYDALDSLRNGNIRAGALLFGEGFRADPQGGEIVISFALSDFVSKDFKSLLAYALDDYADELYRSFQIDSAGVVYQRAIHVYPTNGKFYSNLAVVKSQQGKPREADSLRKIADSLGIKL